MGKNIFDFEFDSIKKLAEIVKENKLEEITLGDGDKMITVRGCACHVPPTAMEIPIASMPAAAPTAAAVSAPAENAAPAPAISGNVVKAPIVGTFYAAPSPDDAPFVTVGKSVKKGDVIFIIESMKVMSEVTSDFDGVVKEILVKNGDALEFDQPVMILE